MRSSHVFIPILFGVICTSAAVAQEAEHRRLDQPVVIQGYSCDRGDAWFYRNGKLNRCVVSRDSVFGEAWVPDGSIISLRPDGAPLRVMLLHQTEIHGVRCAGAGLLGPAEGSVTEFYPSGKIRLCFLAGDQAVQGIPCATGGIWKAIVSREFPIEFAEDGKLKSCGLSADFRGQHRGEKFIQKP